MSKGLYVAFEGGEGTGKTTQIKLLEKFLKERNIRSIKTKEPGGCLVSDDIRKILVEGDANKMSPLTELFLFSASRTELARQVIKPALDSDAWVISDRSFMSSYVYQGYAGKVDLNLVKSMTELAVEDITPDLFILLDIDPAKGVQRSLENTHTSHEKRFESRGLEYHQKIREGYLDEAKLNKNIIVINADQSEEDVFKDITEALRPYLV